MRTLPPARRAILAACLVLGATTLAAQAPATDRPFEPQVGQPGKDVVWVPTADILVARMLDLAEVTPQDVVMDLGSGDGRTVIAAAKRGATAIGVEYNPDMVELSRSNAAREGVTDRATFVHADLFETDISKATVITLFLLPDLNLRLRPRLLDMPPGTRVISNTFTMDDWEADETVRLEGECTSWCTALFWVVPARVEGTWQLAEGQLTLEQEFQMVSGSLRRSGGEVLPVTGRLRGEEISLTAGGTRYNGRVDGGTMQGTVTTGAGSRAWSATRR